MKKNLGFAAILILTAGLLLAAFSVLSLYNRPLGPALELDAPAADIQPAVQPAESGSTSRQADKTCGSSGVMNLLILGQASPIDAGHYGADAIRLARIDFDRQSVSILALPSDLWVNAAALYHPGVDLAALNDIYQQAYLDDQGNQPDDVLARKATQALAQALVDNFGFVVDHYVMVRGEPLIELVDTLGGIEVDVQHAILDVPPGWSTFITGTQTLNGKATLDYVRLTRPADTEYNQLLERFERQNQVLQALLGASLQSENWSALPDLIREFRHIVVTDLSANQADDVACMLKEVGAQARLIQLPSEMVTEEQGRLVPDLPAIRDLIEQLDQPN